MLSLLMLSLRAVAGPVAGDEAASAPIGVEAVPSGTPGVVPLPLDGPSAPAADLAAGRQSSGDAAPAGSALALELLKEAEAGAPANEAVRTARPAAQTASTPASGPKSRGPADGSEADRGLREMGKAALHWLQESLPWLRKDLEDDDRRHDVSPDAVGWSESPLERGKAAGDPAGAMVPAGGAVLPQAGPAAVGYGSTGGNTSEPQRNIISGFFRVVRMVLEHPMTWLIVSLLVVGGIAFRKLDRRPK
jgi:hypothetical protein